jgi:hypothetical protein
LSFFPFQLDNYILFSFQNLTIKSWTSKDLESYDEKIILNNTKSDRESVRKQFTKETHLPKIINKSFDKSNVYMSVNLRTTASNLLNMDNFASNGLGFNEPRTESRTDEILRELKKYTMTGEIVKPSKIQHHTVASYSKINKTSTTTNAKTSKSNKNSIVNNKHSNLKHDKIESVANKLNRSKTINQKPSNSQTKYRPAYILMGVLNKGEIFVS